MDARALLEDTLQRIPPVVAAVVADAGDDLLQWRPDPAANSVGWLTWHIARGLDRQLAALVELPEVWTAGGHAANFDLPFDDAEMGYGQDSEDVAAVQAPAAQLLDYLHAVTVQVSQILAGLSNADLDRVIDPAYDPPVTVGVRIISALVDAIQHAGQAAYIKGLFERRT